MAVFPDQVHAKAKAFVDALCKLARSQYSLAPGAQLAREYNRLRELALEAAPGLDRRLLADEVYVRDTAGEERSAASYVEIETYARQVMEQMALLGSRQSQLATPLEFGNDRPAKGYDVQAIRQKFNQAYQPWTAQDDEHLRARFAEGAPISDLAEEMGRQPGGIRSRLRKLGLAE